MTNTLKFTNQAEDELAAFLDWTRQRFGPDQAIRYSEETFARLTSLCSDELPHQSCEVLTGKPAHRSLGFIWSGQHIMIFQTTEDRILVLSAQHSARDRVRHIQNITPNPKEA